MAKKISQENAEQQLQLLLDYYCLEMSDFENDDTDPDLANAIKQACSKFVRYVRHGLVEVKEEDGIVCVIQYPKMGGDPIKYGIITGRAKMEMRHAKENDMYGKSYYLMAAISKRPFNEIANLKGVDSTVAECIGAIFLMA